VDGSGGYGLVIGPQASDAELAKLATEILANPRGWIARGVITLSTSPTYTGEGFEPRHIDLRPFAVNDGERVWVVPGGLTRVALPRGSLVVNSSQGGGSKDTWVLTPTGEARERLAASAPEEFERLSQRQSMWAPDPGPAGGGSRPAATANSSSNNTREAAGFDPEATGAIGAKLVGESHAWVEAWTGAWAGHDPTNRTAVAERHVTGARLRRRSPCTRHLQRPAGLLHRGQCRTGPAR
jgi:hypothetical protein